MLVIAFFKTTETGVPVRTQWKQIRLVRFETQGPGCTSRSGVWETELEYEMGCKNLTSLK